MIEVQPVLAAVFQSTHHLFTCSGGTLELKSIIEPFRIKVIEAIQMTTLPERREYIRNAQYNPFKLHAKHCIIDLLTDSGTGVMSS